MSLWPREELRVVMGPGQVTVLAVRRSLGWRGWLRSVRDAHTRSFQSATEAQSWAPALLEMETALPAVAKGPAVATVVLSNRFVRYAVVPWQAGLDAQEDLSYARHCFTKVYGKAASQWQLRLSQQAPGRPRVASAVDADLIEGLRIVCERTGVTLRSIQPHLMAAFNDARRCLGQRSAWLALPEPGHLCLALLCNGDWARVRNLRLDGPWREQLAPALEREAFLADDPAVSHEVYVGTLEAGAIVLPEAGDWQFHALTKPVPDVAPVQGAPLAVATAG